MTKSSVSPKLSSQLRPSLSSPSFKASSSLLKTSAQPLTQTIERPRIECLFPLLVAQETEAVPEPGVAASQCERSPPSVLAASRPEGSILSAVTSSFLPVASRTAPTSSAASLQTMRQSSVLQQSPPSVSKEQAPLLPQSPLKAGKRTSPTAALVPYPVSEVSSMQSAWRPYYHQMVGPSISFSRGLLSKDVHYCSETMTGKCVVEQASFPSISRESPKEIESQHRIEWLNKSIEREKEARRRAKRLTRSMTEANVFTDKQLDHLPWSHLWHPAKADLNDKKGK